MAERLIHCVGLSDEDLAHIRLLLRATRKDLRDSWTWGSEARSELIVANPRRLVGESARRRAQQRSVACVQVLEADDAKPNGPFLRKPFTREAVVSMLNRVGRETLVDPLDDDLDEIFADMDLGFVDLSQLEADHPGQHNNFAPGGHDGEPFSAIAPAASADTQPDYSRMPTARDPSAGAAAFSKAYRAARQAIADPVPEPVAEPDPDPTPATVPDIPVIDPDAHFPLSEYISNNLFGSPARIALPHVRALTIDFEQKNFLAQGSLRSLEPYLRKPLRYGDWELLGTEFEGVRRHTHPRPLAMLIWVDRFLHSGGFLPRHINAGDLFRLTKRLEIGDDYPHAFRVGHYMNTPRKLHEVSRMSGVDLDEVFDVVSAYDAIGCIESTPWQG